MKRFLLPVVATLFVTPVCLAEGVFKCTTEAGSLISQHHVLRASQPWWRACQRQNWNYERGPNGGKRLHFVNAALVAITNIEPP